ncbi:hypothetical protein [Sporanaerobacter acetigenes]|uniref:Uncharacterized protein n=1 Tax=Sporanaerobacter acetigenes DSM 13106 TaxID=1123281 RepID=A0A1M5RZ07_9FIRM|nr:hypothetical protein [Sporanaerobacter acetigenes]SHH31414.1 hypothetical protein SAMN02745180_00021 [Sporanaerobacter acetigenes DSM 13106]
MMNLKALEDYQQENEEFYTKLNRDLEEIKSNLRYVLTEQEKQRLHNMTIEEVQTEMLRVLHEMKLDLNEILKKDGE